MGRRPLLLLPLHPLELRILLVLLDGPAHGYRIVKEIEGREKTPCGPEPGKWESGWPSGPGSGHFAGAPFVRSAGIVAAGAAVGILASVALGGVMHSFLFGVSPRDPLALASAPVVLLTAAAVAIWIPVLRHTRVDPAVTMRSE
jgi:hypothetical protein